MDYVTFAEDGALTGGYLQSLHPSHEGHYIVATQEQRINWTRYRANASRNGLEVAPPPVVVPAVPMIIPMLNARLTLITAGKMAAVNEYLASIHGIAGEQAREYFLTALTMERNHPLVVGIPAEIMSEAEKDALFIAAGALNV